MKWIVIARQRNRIRADKFLLEADTRDGAIAKAVEMGVSVIRVWQHDKRLGQHEQIQSPKDQKSRQPIRDVPLSHSTRGPEYDKKTDKERLDRQLERIKKMMLNSKWLTLEEIAAKTNDPPASISAQLRHLRKIRFGGYIVVKRHRNASAGLWEYRVLDPDWIDWFDEMREKLGDPQ